MSLCLLRGGLVSLARGTSLAAFPFPCMKEGFLLSQLILTELFLLWMPMVAWGSRCCDGLVLACASRASVQSQTTFCSY